MTNARDLLSIRRTHDNAAALASAGKTARAKPPKPKPVPKSILTPVRREVDIEILEFEQGTEEWREARRGVATASEFGKIVTPTGKISGQRSTYLGQLLAEWALGEPLDTFTSDWMQRGKEIEPQAREYYGLIVDDPIREVGFVRQLPHRLVGCSPDALVGDDGIWECKCPGAPNHLVTVASKTIPTKHKPQLQGMLYVTGRDWVDFMSYCPDLPPFRERVYPDPKWQASIEEALETFVREIEEGRESLLEQGVIPFD